MSTPRSSTTRGRPAQKRQFSNDGKHENCPAEHRRRPRVNECLEQRERQPAGAGVAVQHVDAGRSPRCPARRSPRDTPSGHRWQSASGTAQISTPIVNVIALPRSAPAAPRPARCTSTSASNGNVSHIACERMPIASADKNAPSTIILPESASASGVRPGFRRCRANAETSAACAASVSASPGTSLIGRPALNQYSGLATVSKVARAAVSVNVGSACPSSDPRSS